MHIPIFHRIPLSNTFINLSNFSELFFIHILKYLRCNIFQYFANENKVYCWHILAISFVELQFKLPGKAMALMLLAKILASSGAKKCKFKMRWHVKNPHRVQKIGGEENR